MFYKLASVCLCPPVQGQVLVDLMVRPPKEGEPSFTLYKSEMDEIYLSLQRRAKCLHDVFNSLESVTCNPAQGSMYLFPQIVFPQKFIQFAADSESVPDQIYCNYCNLNFRHGFIECDWNLSCSR
jgi:aspartate/methionine/tyrosine aminotransferase